MVKYKTVQVCLLILICNSFKQYSLVCAFCQCFRSYIYIYIYSKTMFNYVRINFLGQRTSYKEYINNWLKWSFVLNAWFNDRLSDNNSLLWHQLAIGNSYWLVQINIL